MDELYRLSGSLRWRMRQPGRDLRDGPDLLRAPAAFGRVVLAAGNRIADA
jgi:hypothetical protein